MLDENKAWTKPSQTVKSTSGAKDDFVINPYNVHSVDYNNGVKYVEVQDGDSFESISQEFGMRPWEIYHYNDLEKNAKVGDHKRLYIVITSYSIHYTKLYD